MKKFPAAWLAAGFLGLCAPSSAAPPPASAFAALPEMSFVRLSPNGQRVAWANDPGGKPIVVVFDLATGKDLQRLQPANARVRDLDWADDRMLIISISRTLTGAATTIRERSYEFERYLALDVEKPDGKAQSLLMEHPSRENVTGATLESVRAATPGKVMMSSLSYSETAAGQVIGSRVEQSRRDSGYEVSLFEVDLKSGNGRRIESGSAFTDEWIVDADGRPVARVEWNPSTSQFSILAKSEGSWRSIFATDAYRFDVEGLSADRQSLLATSAHGSTRFRAWSIPLSSGEPTVAFEDPDHDVTSVVFDRYNGSPIGYAIGGSKPFIHWIEPKAVNVQKAVAKAFSGKDVTILGRSADSGRIVIEVEGEALAPVYYLIDFAKGSADIIGDAYPGLSDAKLGSVQFLSYKSTDDFEIPAYLTLPPGVEPKALPLVVFPHGGPYARDTGGFDWWAQFLATQGYAVLQPQFRGSLGYGAELMQAGRKQWGRAMQDDISAGVRHLINQGIADSSRVCIVGASYGGYAALAGAAFTPDLYACAASVNGIADIPQMLGFIREKGGGEESDSFQAWRELIGDASEQDVIASSPSRSIDSIRTPILLIHGTSDTVVPPSQSRRFAELLQQKGKHVELVELPGEDHWLSTAQSRLTVLEKLQSFLATNLH